MTKSELHQLLISYRCAHTSGRIHGNLSLDDRKSGNEKDAALHLTIATDYAAEMAAIEQKIADEIFR